MSRYFYQNRTGRIVMSVIIAIVLIALIAAMAVVFVKLDKQETTTTLKALSWQKGALDDEGEPAENTGFIRTKKFITTEGLKIELQDDATINYSVYFYGENDKNEKVFISCTEALSADMPSSAIPSDAKWVKIVIHPTADAEVNLHEIPGYASQLTVTYNK